MTRFAELISQLPPETMAKGRSFERLCQWYLRTEPIYAGQLRRVWLWDEWPGRWGPDSGIDLVAETLTGDLWAVQAKAYDAAYSVTKADVDSFLSESGRPVFSYRLLIATTNRIGARAEKTLDEQAVPAGLVRLSQLERAEASWPESLADLGTRPPEPKLPRPHSTEAIDAVCTGFSRHDRGQLVMACGTGKTLIGLWVSERLGCKRVLVLVPSLSLVRQTLREWARSATEPFTSLAVCSDQTVETDDLIEHTSEVGIPVTTDPAVIAKVLASPGRHVVLATYQSSPRIAEAARMGAPDFDLAIADEAHRIVGLTDSTFATILDQDAIPARRRLFMTATPRYFTNRVRHDAERSDLEVASMDDAAKFGPVFHHLSFAEAIRRELLSDYQVLIIGVDDAAAKDLADHGAPVTSEGLGVTDARSLASQIGLAKAIREHDLRRVVSFHRLVAGAQRFAAAFPATVSWMPPGEQPSGQLWAAHVAGEMPAGKRDTLVDRLRDLEPRTRGVLANVRCLAEGVDVPALDAVAFIDPRRSAVDITQAVGRAIRRSEDKVKGTVVLPVFIDTTADPQQELDSSAFRLVWDVLRALRAHDDVLGEQLDLLRRELGHRHISDVVLPDRLRLDLPAPVGADFARAFRIRLVEQVTATWEQWYGMLRAFAEREGHPDVPRRHVEEGGFRLGNWVQHQRADYPEKLSAEQIAKLQAIDGWIWDTKADRWEQGFVLLKQYADREDHTRVPDTHYEDGFPLGHWRRIQRQLYDRDELDPVRQARLEQIPEWTWNKNSEDRWDQGYAALKAFAEREGHSRVPANKAVLDDLHLGKWVSNQRTAYRNSKLTPDQVARLQRLEGWTWDAEQARWDETFAALERYTARTGSANPPKSHVEDGFRIGFWIGTQRQAHKNKTLSDERAARLEDIPGWAWNSIDAQWEEKFSQLSAYAKRTGTAWVPAEYTTETGFQLGQWAAYQRKSRNSGKLAPERAKRLKSLPGWSWERS